MPFDEALFWLVVVGFLVFDNLILVPNGCDLLRFGKNGKLRYDASARLTAAGKEIVLLNPLNLFDRCLVTTVCFGSVDPRKWRRSNRLVATALGTLNGFSALGYFYMSLVVCLVVWSLYVGLGLALTAFVGLHLLVWVIATVAMVRVRQKLQLSGYDTFAALAEALFVPAYLMNLGKRLIYKKRVDFSALGLGLRDIKLMPDEDERTLAVIKIRERLDVLEMVQGHEAPLGIGVAQIASYTQDTPRPEADVNQPRDPVNLSATQQWIHQAKLCLTI